jgi:hypothetical protein
MDKQAESKESGNPPLWAEVLRKVVSVGLRAAFIMTEESIRSYRSEVPMPGDGAGTALP